ncbi:VIT1/CCC1 transporter family protein [Lactiplantibacillus daowaiensis]|uniref:VIT family protein n=1 Tax=Lactiplantibacillus daowaiensis TaxID=2559918 RepID=A0ABW1RXP6_9LACO|nr:VIT family protein [Lactiplantibacillus daowaiensis]
MDFSLRTAFKHTILADRLNIIRAGILGANDGIISVSGIVLGAMGASFSSSYLLVSGVAGMLAGACSMAGGEYISVSAQHDIQRNTVKKVLHETETTPTMSRQHLINSYQKRGLSVKTATIVADELMANVKVEAQVDEEVANTYQIKVGHYLNPWHAAATSFLSFITGALIPLMAMTLVPNPYKVLGTLIAMIIALGMNGVVSSHSQTMSTKRTIIRNIAVGLLTTVITFALGELFHTTIGG